MENQISKQIELSASPSRVWEAIINNREFEKWFGLKIRGQFIVGGKVYGLISEAGCEQVKWEAVIQDIKPERLFSFTWHPYAIDSDIDYSKELPTLVGFRLEKTSRGTLLSITESGFSGIPKQRQAEAFQMNQRGWTIQIDNIYNHLTDYIQSNEIAKLHADNT